MNSLENPTVKGVDKPLDNLTRLIVRCRKCRKCTLFLLL